MRRYCIYEEHITNFKGEKKKKPALGNLKYDGQTKMLNRYIGRKRGNLESRIENGRKIRKL